jgi:hypothetical protein
VNEHRDDSDLETTRGPFSSLTRGQFVKAVGGALIGGAILPLESQVAAARTLVRPAALRTLDHASLSALVGQRFYLYHGTSAAAVRLVKVTELQQRSLTRGAHPVARRTETFTLVFRADSRLQLPQGTYSFRHRGLRRFSLFIVPGRGTNRVQHYQAVFHRLAR